MKEKPDFEGDLASIRSIMERSAKFISLSGLAGVMAGIYALVGAYVVYAIVFQGELAQQHDYFEFFPMRMYQLVLVGAITLGASLVTGWYFTHRKAKKIGATMWNATSKRLLINLLIPLISGGLFVIALLWHGYVGHVGPACLIFYGLALVSASPNLVDEVRYLGYCQLLLGIVAAFIVGYSLIFWAIGFGVLHIGYGVLMYRKYDA